MTRAVKTKTCRNRHSFTGPFCKLCKRNRERTRYWSDPEAQRKRKQTEYRKDHPYARIRVVREAIPPMTTQQVECDHELAKLMQHNGKSVYFCFGCDNFIDPISQEVIPEPSDDGEPNAGKAAAPTFHQNGRGAQKSKSPPTKQPESPRGGRNRDDSLMVTVRCQWKHPETNVQCHHQWKVWPQNVPLSQYCPQVHRTAHKRQLNKDRQARFRRQHLN